MMRASALYGRPVVDLKAAEKRGTVGAVLLDLPARRVGGLIISSGQALPGRRQQTFLPAGAIHRVGPDAIMIHGPYTAGDEFAFMAALASLPRVSDLTGRKMVTDSGVLLGVVTDVLIDEADRTVRGYVFDAPNTGRLFTALQRTVRSERLSYAHAEADIHFGKALLVVPEDAVVREAAIEADSHGVPGSKPAAARAGSRRAAPAVEAVRLEMLPAAARDGVPEHSRLP